MWEYCIIFEDELSADYFKNKIYKLDILIANRIIVDINLIKCLKSAIIQYRGVFLCKLKKENI